MTPEEHTRAVELFEELRELSPASQAEALADACHGNAALYSLVQDLLRADQKSGAASFLERNALEDAATLLIQDFPTFPDTGSRVGNYRLGSRIGSGGMGVVFEAEDLRLPRRVAIKLLPPQSFASESKERIQRFEREGRTASSLNHPHIVSILDAAFDQGFYYIAMEFVEGQTLRTLIDESSNTLEAATFLDIMCQTASALSAAHQAGVVHRDIKPENIMVRPDGFIKVLDFGLAMVRESSRDPADLRTKPGHLAGTIQYLSPEQVLGKPASPRSDLFSLGVLAYEMATGQRPFEGATDGMIFDAILNQTPMPPSALRADIGPDVDKMILQLLEKDPDLRFQTAADLRSCCKRLTRDSSRPPLLKASLPHRGRRLRVSTVLVASLTALIGVGSIWFFGHPSQTAPSPLPVHFEQLTDGDSEQNFPSLSPDGKQFVYASHRNGKWDIFLQRTGGRTSLNLTRDYPNDNTQPALSSDGSLIAFRSERNGGGLFVMESTGENPKRVAARGYTPSWSPDRRRLVFCTHTFVAPGQVPPPPSQLYIVNLEDGTQTLLKTGDALQPNWSPHGYRIAYWGLSAGGRRDIFTIAPGKEGQPVPVTADAPVDWNPVWSPSGQQLYFLSDRGGSMNIWRIAMDERSGSTLGPPEPVTVPAESVGSLAIAGSGNSLIYSRTSRRTSLGRIMFDPLRRVVKGTPEPLGEGQTAFNIGFSPDGSQLVYDTIGDVSENLWIMNSDGTHRRLLTSDAYRNRSPQWSPRGDEIMFYSDRSGHYEEWVIHPDGSGLRPLTDGGKFDMQNGAWSPDGEEVLAGRFGQTLLLDSRRAHPVTNQSEAAAALNTSGLFCSAWTDGPDGSLAACDLAQNSGGYEAVVYSPSKDKLEETGIKGVSTIWAPSSNKADSHRALILARDSRCLLYDRVLKRESELFSVSPNKIVGLASAPDGRSIYFTEAIRESTLWVASFRDNSADQRAH